MTLISMAGMPALIRKLDVLDEWEGSPMQLLEDCNNPDNAAPLSPADALSGVNIQAGISPYIISVFGKDYKRLVDFGSDSRTGRSSK